MSLFSFPSPSSSPIVSSRHCKEELIVPDYVCRREKLHHYHGDNDDPFMMRSSLHALWSSHGRFVMKKCRQSSERKREKATNGRQVQASVISRKKG